MKILARLGAALTAAAAAMESNERPTPRAVRIGVVTDALGKGGSAALRFLILQLNCVQGSLQFELVPAPENDALISRLKEASLPWPLKKRWSREEIKNERALELFGGRMQKHLEKLTSECKEPPVSKFVVLSTASLTDNRHSIRKPDGAPLVALIALGQWERTMAPPTEVELFLALLLRQASALAVPDLDHTMHFGSKGCLFDYNQELRDVRNKALGGFICDFCNEAISSSAYPHLGDDLRKALSKAWLGAFDDPHSPAAISAKLGHNLFINKSLNSTVWESIRAALPAESLKGVYAVVGGLLIAWGGYQLGMKQPAKQQCGCSPSSSQHLSGLSPTYGLYAECDSNGVTNDNHDRTSSISHGLLFHMPP
ncbi:hypothetical protein [Paraburkholderia sp. GAS334]|uniref:hypothetical protein n=1 Tax=Paraburkholderia sp. GAS334 TaxID=3035131 RepID=UPI003D1CBA2E